MMEWRLGLTVLKIGNHYRCSRTDILADEVRKSVVASHFARSGISRNNSSKDIFRILMTYSNEEGFELKYEHTIMNAYVPNRSLISIIISVLNLTTLHVLLHYLPQLEYVGVYIIDVIYSMKTNDEDLPTKFNYPKKLRVLHLSTGAVQNGIPCYFSLNIELYNFYMTSYVWIHLVIMYFLPFGIIIICTLLAIKKLIIKQTTINDQLLRSAQHKRRTLVIL
ncbi:unnamed protein product [Rotaria magnacalcarata]|uniref:Uncharacterized protein n=1 Tax=Rotaria magnacalcarata TaxID=392030 RepID=A0A8S2L814_9BILA|nr:unnamed protein product [Rotaria magnacalcarata]